MGATTMDDSSWLLRPVFLYLQSWLVVSLEARPEAYFWVLMDLTGDRISFTFGM